MTAPVAIVGLSFALVVFIFAGACKHRPRPEIVKQDFQYYLRNLATDTLRGRESGSADSRKAAEFIAERMRADGLTPAFRNKFLQPFLFTGGREAGRKNHLHLQLLKAPTLPGGESGEKKLVSVPRLNPEPLPFSPPQTVEGDFIFLGFCLAARDWNDYAGVNVKGKILLCLRYGPGGRENKKYARNIPFRAKFREAKKRGAAGIVFLGREGKKPIRTNQIFAKAEPGPATVFLEHTPLHKTFPFLKAVEEKMHAGERSERVGEILGRVKLETEWLAVNRNAYNVGGYLYPPAAEDRIIVIGAHHDHLGMGHFSSMGKPGKMHKGADDNASGVAVTLEAAGALRGGPRLPKNWNVLFLTFDGEERGLYGSRYFVKSPEFAEKRTAAMINLDMVGRLRESKGLSVQGMDTADDRWKQVLEKAFAAAKFPPDIELKAVRGGSGPSDHTPFYNKDVPVAFLFTGGHRDYHTERDTIKKLNLAGMAAIARMTVATVRGLAAFEKPLAFRKAKSEPRRSAFSFRVRLGVMPGNYETDAQGLEVAGIRDDAPIARSGIKKGDLIVQLHDRPIHNIRDVMDFLSDASLGTKYKVVYMRGEQRLETTTELMSWE